MPLGELDDGYEDDNGPSIAEQLEELLKHTPLTEAKLREAERLIAQCSVEQLTRLGLSAPAKTPPPSFTGTHSFQKMTELIQDYINHFGYNYAPGYHCNVSKQRSFAQLMQTAKNIMLAELPIKCIEAVFIAMHLTAGSGLDRFTLSFKTTSQGQICRHIVLVIRDPSSKCFGALGISRRRQLMFKELAFHSLDALVQDFADHYHSLGHKLLKISLSLLLPHDTHDPGLVGWNSCVLRMKQTQHTQLTRILNDYTDKLASLTRRFETSGKVPNFVPVENESQESTEERKMD